MAGMLPAPLAGAPAPRLSSKVELFLSAKALRRADLLSRSDPFVVVYTAVPRPVAAYGRAAPAAAGAPAYDWQELGRTEVIQDNQEPEWAKRLVLQFHFEEAQPLRFVVWDDDGPGAPPDPLGEAEAPLARIMGSRGQSLTLPLGGPGAGRGSTLTVRASEVADGHNDVLKAVMRCATLDKKDMGFLGIGASSDPFVVISRVLPDGATKQRVWVGPVIKRNLNPVWPEQSIPVPALCNSDPAAPLEVALWDWDSDGGHDFIGAFTTSLNGLLAGAAARTAWPLINPKKVGRMGYKHSGTFSLDRASVLRVPSLLDYIRGGLQINLVVGVDMTGSNGDPRQPNSLHHISPSGAPNEYMSALMAVGSILLEYDSDKRVPMYGFGGAVNGQTRHCFALTFNDGQPEVDGLDGLAAAYQNAFNYVGLSGPTYFEPLVRTADEMARGQAANGGLGYTVLLILTDGQCNDMDATTRAVIDASYGPLSIVIVGVGGADFAAMDFLDSDDALLSAGGKTAARDCVQFVPFRKFAGGTTAGMAGTRLAAEVLAEIPDQVVGHFMRCGVAPPPPVAAVPVPLPAPDGGGAPYGGSPAHAQQAPQPAFAFGGSTRQANV